MNELSLITDVDYESFDALVTARSQQLPVLVDFWADWCQPCQVMAPAIDALADEFADRVRVAKLDVDANPMATHKYGIRGIPALLLFKDGQVVQQIVGVRPKEEIARIIENNL